MAKRLTDTDKWKDDWYVSLSNDYRIIWLWLLDNCNHAGICKRSIALLNRDCNTSITEDDLLSNMDGRVVVSDNIWFIPKFLRFQYPTLQSNKPVIVSVVKEIEKNNLTAMIPESFGNDYLIIKDKSKSKRKDSISLSTEGEGEKETPPQEQAPAHPAATFKTVETLGKEALADTVHFVPAVIMQLKNTNRYPLEQLVKIKDMMPQIMDEFILHVRSEGETIKDVKGFRSHFKNWICKRPFAELTGVGEGGKVKYLVKGSGGTGEMPLAEWNRVHHNNPSSGFQRIA